MSMKDEFTKSEIASAVEERNGRLSRTKVYKASWHIKKRIAGGEEFKKKAAAYMRQWRAKNRDRAREIGRVGNRKYVSDNPATRRKSARDYNARRRMEIFEFFGSRCLHCGFDDVRALQLDHINGGGHQRRKLGQHGLFDKWKMTRETPDLARQTFQVLCANCNVIKRDEDYEYSHKAKLNMALANRGLA